MCKVIECEIRRTYTCLRLKNTRNQWNLRDLRALSHYDDKNVVYMNIKLSFAFLMLFTPRSWGKARPRYVNRYWRSLPTTWVCMFDVFYFMCVYVFYYEY